MDLPYVTDTNALKAQVRAYLSAHQIVAPGVEGVLVAFVQDRMKAQRERLARIVESLGSIYDSLSQEQMDTLAHMIRNHAVDPSGNLIPQDD